MVYVADWIDDKVKVFDLLGSFLYEWTHVDPVTYQPMAPAGIAVGPTGDVFIVEDNGSLARTIVKRFTPAGSLVADWGKFGLSEDDGVFTTAGKITVDANGSVYVTDWTLGNLQKFTSDGGFLYRTDRRSGASAEFSLPAGVHVGPSGMLQVVDLNFPAEAVVLYGPVPFSLAADVDVLAAGDQLGLRTFAGEAGHFSLLFVLKLNGSPYTYVLSRAFLDGDGTSTFTATVPDDPSLSGITLGLATFFTNTLGKVIATNLESIAFE